MLCTELASPEAAALLNSPGVADESSETKADVLDDVVVLGARPSDSLVGLDSGAAAAVFFDGPAADSVDHLDAKEGGSEGVVGGSWTENVGWGLGRGGGAGVDRDDSDGVVLESGSASPPR